MKKFSEIHLVAPIVKSTSFLNNAISVSLGERVVSGTIISEDGYAFTDARIFNGERDKIRAHLTDGRLCEVSLVRADKLNHLALIKLEIDSLNVSGITVEELDIQFGNNLKFWGTPGLLDLHGSYGKRESSRFCRRCSIK